MVESGFLPVRELWGLTVGQTQEFEKMTDESSGNGGRSAGSADSAAARVLWFYSLAIVVIALSQTISSSATLRFL